jgi:hypothetical protein
MGAGEGMHAGDPAWRDRVRSILYSDTEYFPV